MRQGRFLTAQFCDDIRHEVGNKFSLMGCYSQDIIVESLPAVLTKLCVHMKACTPIDWMFERLTFRVRLNDEIIAESVFDESILRATPDTARLSDATLFTATALFVMSPLPIGEECAIRVEAETETTEILRAGRMLIRDGSKLATVSGDNAIQKSPS